MNTLRGSTCTLEPLVVAHAPEMFEVLCDPAIYEFEGEPPPTLEALTNGYRHHETRRTDEGDVLLNWVVRLPTGELTGYVQALLKGGDAMVGYEFSSRFWRRGLATASLQMAIRELASHYGVRRLVAVLKAANYRSLGLLGKLGFAMAPPDEWKAFDPEDDEIVMLAACP